MADKTKLIAGTIGLAVVCIVGLGIADAVIYSKRPAGSLTKDSCPSVSFSSPFEMEKSILNQWSWTYTIGNDAWVNMQCPTSTRDSALYKDNKLVAWTDGKLLDLNSKTYINDCTGKKLFTIQTSDIWQTLANGNRILTYYQIFDSNNQQVGFITNQNLFDSNVRIADMNNNNVATLTLSYLSIPWKWNINIVNSTSVMADMRLLTLLAGKSAFKKSADKDNDMCNQFFFGVATLFAVIAGFLVLAICFVGYQFYKNRHNTNNNEPVLVLFKV